jgi:hypothetical protein
MASPNGSMPIRSTAMLDHAKAMLYQRLVARQGFFFWYQGSLTTTSYLFFVGESRSMIKSVRLQTRAVGAVPASWNHG